MAEQNNKYDELDAIINGRRKILVVDDSPVVRAEVKAILTEDKFEIIEAADGVDGLGKIMNNRDIALILLDINMPLMDGLDMAEKLHDDVKAERLPPIPIVMLTTENSKAKVLRAKGAGVAGWIIKPPKKDHLLQIVEKLAKTPTAA